MPRIVKSLPVDRADYTFGDLVYWHVLEFGTRPKVDPSAKAGRPWRIERLSADLGKTARTLRNWINDESLPEDIGELCTVLFGNNPRWDEARAELLDRYEKANAQRKLAGSPSMTNAELEAAEAKAGQENAADAERTPDEANDDQEEERQRPPNAAGSRELVLTRPVVLRASNDNRDGHRYPRAVASLAAGIALFIGVYAWTFTGSKPRPAVPAPPQVAVVPEPRTDTAPAPPPVRSEVSIPAFPAELHRVEPSKEAAPKPTGPTEAERKAEEERLAEQRRQAEESRKQYDAEQRRIAEDARRRDEDPDYSKRQHLAALESDARLALEKGYRLQEHRSISGSSFANPLVSSVAECADACTRARCDAFGFYREQSSGSADRPRYCYLFRKPFTPPDSHPGYVLGVPIKDRLPARSETGVPVAPVVRVQAKSDDGLVRCATGPVKVSGFDLTCDQTLGGGTTLGSTRLYWTVRNINDCAAKCRPVKGCVGFTFNAADPDGSHTCILFGPTPEARDSKGWISGVR